MYLTRYISSLHLRRQSSGGLSDCPSFCGPYLVTGDKCVVRTTRHLTVSAASDWLCYGYQVSCSRDGSAVTLPATRGNAVDKMSSCLAIQQRSVLRLGARLTCPQSLTWSDGGHSISWSVLPGARGACPQSLTRGDGGHSLSWSVLPGARGACPQWSGCAAKFLCCLSRVVGCRRCTRVV